jgi:uncharacterized protein YoxC
LNNINKELSQFLIYLDEIKERVLGLEQKLKVLQNSNKSDDVKTQMTNLVTKLENLETLIKNNFENSQTQINNLVLEIENEFSSLQQIANENCSSVKQTVTSEITTVKNSVGEISNSLQEINSSVNDLTKKVETALSNLNNSSSSEESVTYEPNLDEILTTKAKMTVWRDYSTQATTLKVLKEFFLINSSSPALLKIEYDLTTSTALNDVVTTIYLNGEIVKTFTENVEEGTTHYCKYITFMLEESGGYVEFEIYSTQSQLKKVSNLQYELVGNNAMFPRDQAEINHQIFPVNDSLYIFKRNRYSLDYKVVDVNVLDFSSNYTTLAGDDTNYHFLPLVCSIATTSSGVTKFVNISYAKYDYLKNLISIIKPTTGTVSTTMYATISSCEADFINSMSFNVSNPSMMVYISCFKNKSTYGLNVSTSFSQNSQYSIRTFDFPVIQAECSHPCMSKYGIISTSSLIAYIAVQSNTGRWYFTSFEENKIPNLDLGVGTRLNLSHIPPLKTDESFSAYNFRIFMFVYDHWVAKYLKYNPTTKTVSIVLVKRLDGDFDQILSGSDNFYFTVKNGEFTKCVDDSLYPISKFK